MGKRVQAYGLYEVEGLWRQETVQTFGDGNNIFLYREMECS